MAKRASDSRVSGEGGAGSTSTFRSAETPRECSGGTPSRDLHPSRFTVKRSGYGLRKSAYVLNRIECELNSVARELGFSSPKKRVLTHLTGQKPRSCPRSHLICPMPRLPEFAQCR